MDFPTMRNMVTLGRRMGSNSIEVTDYDQFVQALRDVRYTHIYFADDIVCDGAKNGIYAEITNKKQSSSFMAIPLAARGTSPLPNMVQ